MKKNSFWMFLVVDFKNIALLLLAFLIVAGGIVTTSTNWVEGDYWSSTFIIILMIVCLLSLWNIIETEYQKYIDEN
jgi:hypothetical protein